MTREDISEGIGNISTRYIQEALNYEALSQKKQFFKAPFRQFGIVAALALCLIVGGISAFSFFNGMTVTAYAYGTDEEITENGAIISTGTINDSGEMVGHPLMFYLSGKDISTVRFSCKNQQINFMDWTEKRDEYGLAQNFTVSYGEDENEYYYLLIDWVPNATIRELTDNKTSMISTLPDEMRNDMIVMEINFQNGKTVTKAIKISLLDDGTFSATFEDYKINDTDKFVNRPDSEAIPRDVLYKQGNSPACDQEYQSADAPVIEDDYKDADPNEPVKDAAFGKITFTGTIVDNLIESLVPVLLVEADKDSGLDYDTVLFELTEEQKNWESEIGTHVQIVCSDIFEESIPPIGSLISIQKLDNPAENNEPETAKSVVEAYYKDTVFEIVSMKVKNQTSDEISFSVWVSKGGVIQEPNRTIYLQLVNENWEVVNEGY